MQLLFFLTTMQFGSHFILKSPYTIKYWVILIKNLHFRLRELGLGFSLQLVACNYA